MGLYATFCVLAIVPLKDALVLSVWMPLTLTEGISSLEDVHSS